MRSRLGMVVLVVALGAVYVAVRGQGDPWPRTLVFDSSDHPTLCPADRCVSAYLLEVWPAAGVGQYSPVWKGRVERWEVTPTGTAPAYQLPVRYPPLGALVPGVDYVWTLRALGEGGRNSSPLSAPTAETFRVDLNPATNVRVQ